MKLDLTARTEKWKIQQILLHLQMDALRVTDMTAAQQLVAVLNKQKAALHIYSSIRQDGEHGYPLILPIFTFS
jgi:hypothetical protein